MSKASKINRPFNQALGSFLRSYRNEVGLSLTKLNSLTGLDLSKSSLSAIERGRQQITAYQLFLISRALHLTVDELFLKVNVEMMKNETKIIGNGNIINLEEL